MLQSVDLYPGRGQHGDDDHEHRPQRRADEDTGAVLRSTRENVGCGLAGVAAVSVRAAADVCVGVGIVGETSGAVGGLTVLAAVPRTPADTQSPVEHHERGGARPACGPKRHSVGPEQIEPQQHLPRIGGRKHVLAQRGAAVYRRCGGRVPPVWFQARGAHRERHVGIAALVPEVMLKEVVGIATCAGRDQRGRSKRRVLLVPFTVRLGGAPRDAVRGCDRLLHPVTLVLPSHIGERKPAPDGDVHRPRQDWHRVEAALHGCFSDELDPKGPCGGGRDGHLPVFAPQAVFKVGRRRVFEIPVQDTECVNRRRHAIVGSHAGVWTDLDDEPELDGIAIEGRVKDGLASGAVGVLTGAVAVIKVEPTKHRGFVYVIVKSPCVGGVLHLRNTTDAHR